MSQTLVIENTKNFEHIIRIMNSNLKGKVKVVNALCGITGLGRRMASLICKIAKIDVTLRAGQVPKPTWELVEKIILNPEQHGVPNWFLNRRGDYRTNKDMHCSSNVLDTKIREDLERLKKTRNHRGLRHHWLLKVRGQHTNSTGRRGVQIGVIRKDHKLD